MSATIVFRGLMVFHKMGDHMEIGVVKAPAHAEAGGHAAHVPRIIKTTNGVINSIFDLRDLSTARDWELEVSNPLQPTATRFRQGEEFGRLHHPIAKDFRWLADLEGEDLHNRDLTAELDMTNLLLVLRVRHGRFYTQQLSRPLNRRNVNPPAHQVSFGRAAEVVGCKIDFEMGSLTLKAGTLTTPVYTFDEGDEDGVVYEISNAPPDVAPDGPYQPGPGHFAMYYTHLFKNLPQDEYRLIREGDPMPSPDPALCGAVVLGTRSGGL
ncbi:MAG TPA: hypothetical protein VGC73_06540 [Pyrinomonadaceae bacterium]|jgi:hypothetical protein